MKKLWAQNEPFRRRLLTAFSDEEVSTLINLLGRVTKAMAPAHVRASVSP